MNSTKTKLEISGGYRTPGNPLQLRLCLLMLGSQHLKSEAGCFEGGHEGYRAMLRLSEKKGKKKAVVYAV